MNIVYQSGISSEMYTSIEAKMKEKIGILSGKKSSSIMMESHKGIHVIYLISVSARILGGGGNHIVWRGKPIFFSKQPTQQSKKKGPAGL